MSKRELGQLVCYLWLNADQAPIMDHAEFAFRNCPKKAQLELLSAFVDHIKDDPENWLDKPERVKEAIAKAEELLRKIRFRRISG